MRRIKFRSFLKSNGKMLYDFTQLSNNDNTDDELRVLMQYTGLKDKNGTEIYEGDILRLLDSDVMCEVVYNSPSFCRKWLSPKVKSLRGVELESMAHNTHIAYEVIGNIYEHPHLI